MTGFLGSGKTIFLIKLAKELESRGNRVALVVNDVGHINVDQKLMESNHLKVKEVAGGRCRERSPQRSSTCTSATVRT